MPLKLPQAVQHVLEGESLRQLYNTYRDELLREMDFEPKEAPAHLFRKESLRFVHEVARKLGERHAGDRRAGAALEDYVQFSEEYEVFDALLSNFRFQTRQQVLSRGRVLFPGTLTAHWEE